MKSFTRTLPLTFHGELHDVELVQFSLDPDEARAHLPEPLAPRIVAGRACVSLVNVRLEGMRPLGVPRCLTFGFRHVAFRMLVDDAQHNEDSSAHGIFFARSFTEKPLVAWGADWLSHYRLTRARIQRVGEGDPTWEIRQPQGCIRYRLEEPAAHPVGAQFADWEEARRVVTSIDRAYAVDGRGRLWRTLIHRPGWPTAAADVSDFHVDFFESARLEGGFRVTAPVPYRWSPPEVMPEPCAS